MRENATKTGISAATSQIVTRAARFVIREVMSSDDEPPRLSASIGISVYRGDGERIEKLLSEADQDLYAEKAKRVKRTAAGLKPRHRTPKTQT